MRRGVVISESARGFTHLHLYFLTTVYNENISRTYHACRGRRSYYR